MTHDSHSSQYCITELIRCANACRDIQDAAESPMVDVHTHTGEVVGDLEQLVTVANPRSEVRSVTLCESITGNKISRNAPIRQQPSATVQIVVLPTFAMAATWSLSAEEREATVERIAKNISSIAFFKGLDISDADAKAAAVTAEKKAYTAAQVAARTTTGNRPHAETTSGYAR